MLTADARVDLAKELDFFVLYDALAQGSRGCQVPEQLGSNDNIVARPAGKLLMLLSFRVVLVFLNNRR